MARVNELEQPLGVQLLHPSWYTPEYQHVRNAVNEAPEDWTRRNILADWCEENGDPLEAEFWRWTATMQKRAWLRESGSGWYVSGGRVREALMVYCWYAFDPSEEKSDQHSGLPSDVFRELSDPIHDCNQNADNALMMAWKMTNGEVEASREKLTILDRFDG